MQPPASGPESDPAAVQLAAAAVDFQASYIEFIRACGPYVDALDAAGKRGNASAVMDAVLELDSCVRSANTVAADVLARMVADLANEKAD